jgi:hypothetical protein
MWESATGLAYVMCAALIAAYAWERFNTPATNRSSTRQTLYWSAFLGYLVCALTLFASLSMILQIGAWRTALLGASDKPSLPAPLIATLALTTLLPSVPLLKRLDASLLALFHDWGEIPAEVKRRAAEMTTRSFSVTEQDVTALREAYGDGSYGEALAEQLRSLGADGIERSRLRFTRVVKLYDRVTKLAGEDSYARFFDEASAEYAELNRQVSEFLRRSAESLALAARLQANETVAVYEELMQERRVAFAQACKDTFSRLALFLARAVLRSEPTEAAIVDRLRAIGFEAEPIRLPAFPIDSLTALALGVFVYVAGLGIFFAHLPSVPSQPGNWFTLAFKIALVRMITVGLTVWLLQRYPFFRRAPGASPRYFAYFVCGIVASAVSLCIVLPFHLWGDDFVQGMRTDIAPVACSGVLCLALALCCDGWPSDVAPPIARRLLEAGGCGAAMALGSAFVYFSGLLQLPVSGRLLTLWFVLPSLLATAIGGLVPHIYRSARHAASARRETSAEPIVAQQPQQVLAAVG